MNTDFKHNFFLAFLFSKNLDKVCLFRKDSNPFIDGYIKECTKDLDIVGFSKSIFDDTSIKVNPSDIRLVLNLNHIEKKLSITVYCYRIEDDVVINNDSILYDINNLPAECYPSVRWLVPLCLDACVVGSSFNQIIIR